ncbi:ligand-binding sensor domain-containing protein [Maribacter luteus]|uniref:ligand-binding sensor domain-containing protein n=1 Tax=Maribacter luteus TaxID=2594478 RepID=UPI0024907E4E|nr:two-component regulator propeller domain-containing protein [Maribacter luteus]
MQRFLVIVSILIATNLYSQNIFIEQYDDCNVGEFCLDCGNPKAKSSSDIDAYFKNVLTGIPKKLKGDIYVQVIVDSLGNQCVKSIQRDLNQSSHNLEIRRLVNEMKDWSPSIDKNGHATSATVFLKFKFKGGKVKVDYQNFFDKSFMSKIKSEKPELKITNNKYSYSNDLVDDQILVFDKRNSKIRHSYCRSLSIDKDGVLWVGTDNGLLMFDDPTMKLFNSKNSSLRPENYNSRKTSSIMHSAIDSLNNKWFNDGYNTYRFDGNRWKVFDSINSPLGWGRRMYADNKNNMWIASGKGVARYSKNEWTIYDNTNTSMPSNRASGVFVDSKNRIWIGTYEGNVMIDNGKEMLFNDSETPLKNGSILDGFEDKKGNLWFSLYSEGDKYSGLAKLASNGEWSIMNIENSKIPTNSIADFAIDEERNIIWIGAWKVGLAKYDGNKWSLYTLENSKFPSVYISDMELDSDGNLWVGTFSGFVKVIVN